MVKVTDGHAHHLVLKRIRPKCKLPRVSFAQIVVSSSFDHIAVTQFAKPAATILPHRLAVQICVMLLPAVAVTIRNLLILNLL